ncbi:MAG: hypothetical protein RLZZ214_717 [Verrucomicrobiota bacterium]
MQPPCLSGSAWLAGMTESGRDHAAAIRAQGQHKKAPAGSHRGEASGALSKGGGLCAPDCEPKSGELRERPKKHRLVSVFTGRPFIDPRWCAAYARVGGSFVGESTCCLATRQAHFTTAAPPCASSWRPAGRNAWPYARCRSSPRAAPSRRSRRPSRRHRACRPRLRTCHRASG